MKHSWRLALSGASFLPVGTVMSQPQQWCGNGNWYEVVVTTNISWTAARVAAEARGGHLASITSAAENAFVANLVSSTPGAVFLFSGVSVRWIGPWIGGYQPGGSPEPTGGWRWITPEPWVYVNWASDGQPDNAGNAEHYLHFSNVGEAFNGTWNDRRDDDGNRDPGYVVEYESAIISGPAEARVCSSSPVEMDVDLVPGTDSVVTVQWQGRSRSGHPWIDLVDGMNAIPGAIPFVASGAQTTGMVLTPAEGEWTFGEVAEFRCVVASDCRADESAPVNVIICAADYNCDKGVEVIDLLDFVEDLSVCTGMSAPCGTYGNADINGDTLVDILDFLDFIDAFSTGC